MYVKILQTQMEKQSHCTIMLKYGFWSNISKESIIGFMGKNHSKVRRERERKEINLKIKTEVQ